MANEASEPSRLAVLIDADNARPSVVEGLLAELPDRERQVLELRFREDLMQREIADRLGISQMQVSRLIARSLASLRPENAPRQSA